MPGTIEQRATLLKAAESIEDDTQREAAINALKASDTAMSGAWQTRGVPGQPDADSPDGEVAKLAKQYAAKHDVSIPAATVAVIGTPEGKAAYAKQRR